MPRGRPSGSRSAVGLLGNDGGALELEFEEARGLDPELPSEKAQDAKRGGVMSRLDAAQVALRDPRGPGQRFHREAAIGPKPSDVRAHAPLECTVRGVAVVSRGHSLTLPVPSALMVSLDETS